MMKSGREMKQLIHTASKDVSNDVDNRYARVKKDSECSDCGGCSVTGRVSGSLVTVSSACYIKSRTEPFKTSLLTVNN